MPYWYMGRRIPEETVEVLRVIAASTEHREHGRTLPEFGRQGLIPREGLSRADMWRNKFQRLPEDDTHAR